MASSPALFSVPLDTWDQLLRYVDDDDVKSLVLSSTQLHNACVGALRREVLVHNDESLQTAAKFWLRPEVGRLVGGKEVRGRVKSVIIGISEHSSLAVRVDYNLLRLILLPFVNTTSLTVKDQRMPWNLCKKLLVNWRCLNFIDIGYFLVNPTLNLAISSPSPPKFNCVRHLSLVGSNIWSVEGTPIVFSLAAAPLESLSIDLTGFNSICTLLDGVDGSPLFASSPVAGSIRKLVILSDLQRRTMTDVDYARFLGFCEQTALLTDVDCRAGDFELSISREHGNTAVSFTGIPWSLKALTGNWSMISSPWMIERVSIRNCGHGYEFMVDTGNFWMGISKPYMHLTTLFVSFCLEDDFLEDVGGLGNLFPMLKILHLVVEREYRRSPVIYMTGFIEA
ncbi:hypothetical protein AAF712_014791 [Marasmius tenuissimus]|uniref:F-box domain-containing protein n=1 Tax=Marasmius tenuissimus TaxID=585030 RepID=A0ABR2ZA31_9AGAR